jgi:hypothetical protein
MPHVPITEELLDTAKRIGEENADRMIEYSLALIAMRRRVKAALVVLEQGRTDTAKRLLTEALADDGKFIKRRIDKVVKKFADEYSRL